MSNVEIVALIIIILVLLGPVVPIGIFVYRFLIKRYPYLKDSNAIDIINNSSVKSQSEALKIVYKKSKNRRVVSKFNKRLAREIFYLNKNLKEN